MDYFYIIARGNVEIAIKKKMRNGTLLAHLSPGEFFGNVELLRSGQAITSVCAATDGPVELLALRRDEFLPLLKSSPLTEEALARIVQKKIENRE